MKKRKSVLKFSIILVCIGIIAIGCTTTKAQKGAAIGAAGGSLAGLAIGSMTGSAGTGAAIGAAAGTALGYVIGNEMDKDDAKAQAAAEREALQKAKITEDPQTAYHKKNIHSLVGTTWRVVSLESPRPYSAFSDMVVTFQTNTQVTTLTVLKDGKTATKAGPYRIVDDILILTDSETKKMVNTKYIIKGKRMTITGGGWKIVMDNV